MAMAHPHQGETTDQDQHDMVKNMVIYMLNQSISKLPIKKSDIVASCLRGKGKLFQPVYEIAEHRLKEIYGMSIHRANAINSNKVTQFLCVSRSTNAAASAISAAEQKTLPVLFLVLAYIYMKGGQLSDHSVFRFLEKCGVPVSPDGTNCTSTSSSILTGADNDDGSSFGDVRKLVLDTFVKQLYILKTKTTQEANKDVVVTLSWGQRAELEFTRLDVLGAVAQVMGRTPESFAKHFRECQQADIAASQAEADGADE